MTLERRERAAPLLFILVLAFVLIRDAICGVLSARSYAFAPAILLRLGIVVISRLVVASTSITTRWTRSGLALGTQRSIGRWLGRGVGALFIALGMRLAWFDGGR